MSETTPQLYRLKDDHDKDLAYEITARLPEGRVVIRQYPYPVTGTLRPGDKVVMASEIEPIKSS